MTTTIRRPRRRPGETRDPVCHWCHDASTITSPYRTSMPEVIGGAYVVCSPGCPDRPAGVVCYEYRRPTYPRGGAV